jgi:phosphoribosylpyrophosphate synthetase
MLAQVVESKSVQGQEVIIIEWPNGKKERAVMISPLVRIEDIKRLNQQRVDAVMAKYNSFEVQQWNMSKKPGEAKANEVGQ